jgi:diguanylate cyclase (GGDEF)-like protein
MNSIQPSAHVDFAMLYTWIVVFAALYFRPLSAVLHLGVVGAAYAVVLSVGPSVDNPVTAWMATFGSSAVLCGVTISLVNVLCRTSREDVLTGLANRRAWDDRLDEELERARRSKTALSLALIDVDNFKAVNDRDGHPAGDRLLRDFANGWRDTIRGSGDFLARLGGDEFGLLAPSTNDMGIQRVAKRLHETTPGGVSCSIGVATWDRTETAADLFRRVDEAMYRAKRKRRVA